MDTIFDMFACLILKCYGNHTSDRERVIELEQKLHECNVICKSERLAYECKITNLNNKINYLKTRIKICELNLGENCPVCYERMSESTHHIYVKCCHSICSLCNATLKELQGVDVKCPLCQANNPDSNI
jgi:hypothetical protein